MKIYTAERSSAQSPSDNVIFQRHLIAYQEAKKLISGNVLEIGCGTGYGIPILAPQTENYTAIDKFVSELSDLPSNVKFIQTHVPELIDFEDNAFDFVVSFQVIEHIKDDHTFLKEIHRVLKPGGKLIFTTPNKKMTLSRNPFHIREYTVEEMSRLVHKFFTKVNHQGVFGNEKVMDYHEKNRASVKKITRFDIFNLQYRLPRFLLQIPYDLANRLNRLMLNKSNTKLVSDIQFKDFYLSEAKENCLDHFCICEK